MPRPDEGLIHAWLDGQLPTEEAERIEQLVATDAEWAAAAAEARGLVAASSRIVAALDHVPRGVLPQGARAQGTGSPAVRRLPWWTRMAAAVVLVAGATTVVLQRVPEQTTTPAPQVKQELAVPKVEPVVVARVPAAAPARAVQAEVSGTQRADRALAESPAIAPAPRDEALNRAADVARRDVPRAEAQHMEAQRGAAGGSAAKTVAAPAPPQVVGGVARAVSASAAAPSPASACYKLLDSRTSVEAGVIMRLARTDGDTLRLEAARLPSPMRAWVVLRDGVSRGVLTTDADGRGALVVTATPVACPAP
ncbi:MAG: hypothetical protein NTW72_12660 [Gemmatimonadetes bacterium]|nr:hypothetical protein [Gemmatimonadota bacterium]